MGNLGQFLSKVLLGYEYFTYCPQTPWPKVPTWAEIEGRLAQALPQYDVPILPPKIGTKIST